jgi:hypothetical protein
VFSAQEELSPKSGQLELISLSIFMSQEFYFSLLIHAGHAKFFMAFFIIAHIIIIIII